jgi:quercetin dioxygenase-like cupin family protein
MIHYKKLDLTFDVERMKTEALGFEEERWIPHFNKGYYSGDWSAIPFRSPNGEPNRIFPDPTGKLRYENTIHLEGCPYLKQVIDTFECEKTAVRLLRLNAGSVIKEHSDYDLSYEDGEVRLHIPVTTNPEMEFNLNRERVVMSEGECWYLNFNLPHSVSNLGETNRIHLVMDCMLNDWLKRYFL